MSEQNVVDAPQSYDAEESFAGGDSGSGDFEGSDGSGSGAPGAGQSKSSRRRRRKRRNKLAGEPGTPEAATGAPATVVMEGESLALAASAPPAPAIESAPSAPRRISTGGTHNAGGTGNVSGQPSTPSFNGASAAGPGKRWKKKFRDRERRPGRSETSGSDTRSDNSAGASNGGGSSFGGSSTGSYGDSSGYSRGARPDNFGNRDGFKRKSRPGGSKERSFVGPMDHSYREGNGADAPPSTIQVHSHGRRGGHRHQGDNQPLDFSGPRPVPIPENAQTHIYFFIEDLFLTAKIQETSRKQGVKVAFVKNEKEAVAELTNGEVENRPALIVFDLNNANAKPLTLIPKLKSKLKRSVSIIGFLSHLQGDLKAKAVEAGCDVVVPRAAFSQNLPNLLRRYGTEEEEEVNFNY